MLFRCQKRKECDIGKVFNASVLVLLLFSVILLITPSHPNPVEIHAYPWESVHVKASETINIRDDGSVVTGTRSQQVFDVHEEFGTGSTASIEWGDFDNDGDPDLAVGHLWYEDNYLYINNGNGTFSPKTQFTTGYRQRITLAAGDYDNDGDLDMALGASGDHRIELYANDGNGMFILDQELLSEYGCYSLVWGDYDNDGDLDLATGQYYQDILYVNNGNGTFTAEEQFNPSSSMKVAWADVNNDTYLDLAVGSYGANHLYINNGNGTFTEHVAFGEGYTSDLAWGDYDNDGDPDLVLATGYAGYDYTTYLYVNNGDETFTQETPFKYAGQYVAWGDYDGDRKLDLAVARQDMLCIYGNNGDGTFSIRFITLYKNYGPVAWEDYDKDGDLDLAVGNPDYNQPNYLLVNQIVPNPPTPSPESQYVWVDDDWAGSHPGDPVNGHVFGTDAFANIQDAIDVIASPGTVYVAAGTYVENINFLGKAITVKSESGAEKTIINGSDIASVVTFESGEGLDSILDGFKITGARGLNNYGIRCYRGSATIINNVIQDNAGLGICLYKSISVIRNNTIYGNPEFGPVGPSDALHAGESILIIENNTILATDPNGNINAISVTGGELPQSFLISSNVIKGRVYVSVSAGALTFENEISNNIIIVENLYSEAINVNIEYDATLSIVNNVIHKGGGIFLQRGGDNTRIVNNIITECNYAIESGSGYLEILNNDLWDNKINYAGIPDQKGINGNICADPMFVDVAGGDYHLKRRVYQTTSPCIDAGTNEGTPDNDFDGNPRPIDGDGDGIAVVDMGAFEYALAHELDIYLEAPMYLEPSASSLLNATVYNDGLSNETVSLFLLINGTVARWDQHTLAIGKSYTLSYNWTSTAEAIYNVTAYATPTSDEIHTGTNKASRMISVVWYKNVNKYFRILVPPWWTYESGVKSDAEIADVTLYGPTEYNFTVNINVVSGSDPEVKETKTYLVSIANAAIGIIRESFDSFLQVIHSPTYTTINEHAAVTFVVKYQFEGFTIKQKQVLIVSDERNYFWAITATALAKNYEEYEPTFDAVINGFKVLPRILTFFEESSLWISLGAVVAILAPTPLVLKRRTPQPTVPTTVFEYVGVGRRFAASAIDGILITFVSSAFGYIMFPTIFTVIPTSRGVTTTLASKEVVTFLQFLLALSLIDALVTLVYQSLMEGYIGATIGKLALKIRVLGEDGDRCGLGSAYTRNLLHYVDMAPYIIPYLLGVIKIRKSPKKQRLGDKVSRTIVVKKGVSAPAVQPSLPKLFCGQCGKEISPEFNLCPFCGAKILRQGDIENRRDEISMSEEDKGPNILMGTLAGIAVAIVGATMWAALTIITKWQVGIAASVLGYVVGFGVLKGSKVGGRKVQLIAALLATGAIVLGDYMIYGWIINQEAARHGIYLDPATILYLSVFDPELNFISILYLSDPMGAMYTILFIALGIYAAYRTPRPKMVASAPPETDLREEGVAPNIIYVRQNRRMGQDRYYGLYLTQDRLIVAKLASQPWSGGIPDKEAVFETAKLLGKMSPERILAHDKDNLDIPYSRIRRVRLETKGRMAFGHGPRTGIVEILNDHTLEFDIVYGIFEDSVNLFQSILPEKVSIEET